VQDPKGSTSYLVTSTYLLIQGFKNIPNIKSPLVGCNKYRSMFGGQGFIPE
jgi:hypothetical protein